MDFQPHSDRYEVCGRRAVNRRSSDKKTVTVAGTIHRIQDDTPVDGPVNIVLVDQDGELRKLYFGSLFTRPSPSEQRKATYKAIAASRIGDCVQVIGSTMSDGKIWVEQFINLDKP